MEADWTAAADSEFAAAMSKLAALDSTMVELETEKKELLAFLATKLVLMDIQPGGNVAAVSGAAAEFESFF